MKIFTPPFSERSTEELLDIHFSTEDEWQEEARIQAGNELMARGFDEAQLEKLAEGHQHVQIESQKEREAELEANATDSYHILEMIFIFLLAPLTIARIWRLLSIIGDLRKDNFQLKLRQRALLMIAGVLFWIFIMQQSVEGVSEERLQEIEDVDISDWEKNRIGD